LVGTFLLVLPFAFVGALSPVMLTQQVFVLATADGRRAAARYAIGAVVTLYAFTALMTFFGRAISLPAEPTLSDSLDIVLGLLLLLAAFVVVKLRRKALDPVKPAREEADGVRLGPRRALGFGAFSMATNLTTLAVIVPAAKIIAGSELDAVGRGVLVTLVVLIASTPAWLPIALTRVAPGPAEHALRWVGNLIETRGRQLVVLFLIVLGLFLLVRGMVGAISL